MHSYSWGKLIVGMLVAALFATAAYAVTPDYSKLSPSLARVARAVVEGNSLEFQQRSLTKQMHHQSASTEVHWNAAGEVQVYIYYDSSSVAPNIQALVALGATDTRDSPLLGVVQAWIPASKLLAVSKIPWVRRVSEPHYTISNSYNPPPGARVQPRSVDTTGDQVMGSAAFRAATGSTGSGITVGVISGDAAGLSQSQAAGDLPSSVWIDPSSPGATSEGEGTAMMEIVHQMAPGANLAFCGPATSAEFVNCISDLGTTAQANIIVDDLSIPLTAYFTYDSDVLAIQQWQSLHPSVRLVTSAGNFAEAFWSGAWNPTALSTTINGVAYSVANNFGSSSAPAPYLTIQVAPSDAIEYILQWDDPWVLTSQITGSTPDDPNDYDLVLADFYGNVLACSQGQTGDSSGCTQAGAAASSTPGPQPVIGNIWTNPSASTATVYLYVLYRGGSPGTQLKLFVGSRHSCLTTITPKNAIGSIVSHAMLPYPAEISVGAVNVNTPSQLESFSSQGPINLPLVSSSPIMKPDFVATDGVSVSGSGGNFPPIACGATSRPPAIFYGTSAAAPHIAALIALLESAGYSSDQVYSVLQNNSVSLGTPNPNGAYGYGRPNISAVPSLMSSSSGSSASSAKSSGGGGGGANGVLILGLLVIVLGLRGLAHRSEVPSTVH